MGGKYDFWIIGLLVLLVTFMLISRHYDDKLRRKRLLLKKKNPRFILGIKQYSLIFAISVAIAVVAMFIFKITIWE